MGVAFELADLMPGARNFVKFAGITGAEEVLIVAAYNTEEVVIQSVMVAVQEQGAIPTLTHAPPPELYFKESSEALAEAMLAADVVLDLGAFVCGHSMASIRAMTEYLTRGAILSPPPTAEILKSPAALYPLELHYAVAKKVFEMCQQPTGTRMHLTSRGGTDLTAQVMRERTGGGGQVKPLAPGLFGIFPPGIFGFIPPLNVDGVAVYESYVGFGKCSEPIKMTIENSWATKIEGGWEADELKARIKDVENANHIIEIMFGIAPKNRVNLNIRPLSFESERSPRTLHIGMGDQKMQGGPMPARGKGIHWKVLHQDGYMLHPTLKVGDKVVLHDGHLTALDDPEIIEFAKRFGDPAELFRYPAIIS